MILFGNLSNFDPIIPLKENLHSLQWNFLAECTVIFEEYTTTIPFISYGFILLYNCDKLSINNLEVFVSVNFKNVPSFLARRKCK